MKVKINYQVILFVVLFIIIQSCKSSDLKKEPKTEPKIDSKNFLFKDLKVSRKFITKEKLTGFKFKSLKNYLKIFHNIELDTIKYLTISYLKPRSDCWYDNQKFLNSKKSNFITNKIRSELNGEILFLHFDDTIKPGESKLDKVKFIYNFLPQGKKQGFCDYTFTVSYTGNSFFIPGHFYIEVANAFKNELKIIDSNE